MVREIPSNHSSKNYIPKILNDIDAEWARLATEHGDEGSCVIGAGFNFRFNDRRYRMTPGGRWQGSISWEHYITKIRTMLHDAGADGIGYDWGNLD